MKTGFFDWTDREINLYIFDRRGGEARLVDTLSSPLDGELTPSLPASLVKNGIEDVYLSIPLSLLALREQDFPFSDRDKIRDTLAYELEGLLLGSVSDYSIDHIVTDSSESGSRVLAVCVEKARLRGIIDMFASAGVEPRVVTSLDLRLSGGRGEDLLDEPVAGREARAGAAGQELLNPSVNLRRDELSYQGDIEKFRKKLRLTAVLVIILLALLGAGSMLRLVSLDKEHAMLQERITAVYRRVFPEDKKIIDAARQFKGNMNLLMKKKDALAGIPLLDILRSIADIKESGITLYELTAEGTNLMIKGTAGSFEEVEAFRNSLSAEFKGVKVVDSGTSADKKISFTIIMQEKSV